MVALVLAPAAAAGGFVRAKQLEPAASYVAGKPVEVLCATSEASWHTFMLAVYGANDGAHGSTTPGAAITHLDFTVCSALAYQLGGGSVADATLAPSIQVITHESVHARGVVDEGATACDAMHEMPRVAVRFFGVKAGKQLRALMAAAWAWYREAAPAFRTVCG